MKYQISKKDELSHILRELEELGERIEERVKQLGFIPFAPPEPTEEIRRLIQVNHRGKVKLLSELSEEEMREYYEFVPPSDLSTISDTALQQLMQWWYAIKVARGKALAKLDLEYNLAKCTYERTLNIAKLGLRGKLDPDTNKVYTQAARKEAAEISKEVLEAKQIMDEREGEYKLAEAIYKMYRDTIETLNRQRMAREADEEGAAYGRYKKPIEAPIYRKRSR